jgi:cbb3-type cytochrome oxidase subunit 1
LLSRRFIYTAVAFFVVGVSLGMYMGINKDFRLTHVHVHINLLGWVALGLAGLLYNIYPHLQRTWMAHTHYWLHTIGLIIFMSGFAWGAISGEFQFIPVSVGASLVSLGVMCFAINVFTRLGVVSHSSVP